MRLTSEPAAFERVLGAPAGAVRADADPWAGVLSEVMGERPLLDVADVGCRDGKTSILLAGLGHRVRGVDPSPAMIEAAAVQARQRSAWVELCVADAWGLPFGAASMDVVHARNPPELSAAVFLEWSRVLRKGGVLVLAQIGAAGLHAVDAAALLRASGYRAVGSCDVSWILSGHAAAPPWYRRPFTLSRGRAWVVWGRLR